MTEIPIELRKPPRWNLYRGGFLVIVYAICLHLSWAVALLLSDHPIQTTPTAYMFRAVGQNRSAAIYIGVALMTVAGLFRPGWPGLLLSLPQNAILALGAASGIASALVGHYPDGVIRPGLFILVDQMPMILVAVLHAACLVVYHSLSWTRSS